MTNGERRVTFGELVRIVERIDVRTAGMAASLPEMDTRLTVLEVIHPDHEHRGGGGIGAFAKLLAVIGTIVFSGVAGIATAVARVADAQPK
jgi:hypothetical protein